MPNPEHAAVCPAFEGTVVKEREQVIRYMYVEDDEEIRDVVASLMEASHRDIVAVADAEAALALLAQGRSFDVLVTDVGLPGLSGTDLARHWLASDASRHVLLLSGYEFGHGLQTLGPHVRALLKSSEPEELDATLRAIEAALAVPG